jgi:hypothetical protein
MLAPAARAVGLSLALVLLACNSDSGSEEPMSLEDYLQQIGTLMTESESEADAVKAEIDEQIAEATEVDSAIDAFEDGVGQFQDLAGDILNDLNDLNPPTEAAAAHASLIDSFEEGIATLDTLDEELDGVDTNEEFLAFSESAAADFSTLDTATEAACQDLQSLAGSAGVDVDLGCGD